MFAATILLALAPAPAHFAPPLDRPIHVVTERIGGEGPGGSNHRVEREITFSRDGDGYRAEIHMVGAAVDGGSDARAMFQAGYSGLAGRALVFRLDADGRVAGMDDLAGHWQAFCQGIAAIFAAAPRDRPPEQIAALRERIVGPLRALPEAKQLSMLASLIDSIIPEERGESPGTIAVRVPGASPFGGATTLLGTRTIAHDGALLHSRMHAAGDVSAPAEGSAPARTGTVTIDREREIDALTGLLLSETETVSTIVDGEETKRVTRVHILPN